MQVTANICRILEGLVIRLGLFLRLYLVASGLNPSKLGNDSRKPLTVHTIQPDELQRRHKFLIMNAVTHIMVGIVYSKTRDTYPQI